MINKNYIKINNLLTVKMRFFNEKGLKKRFWEKGTKIGAKTLKYFIKVKEHLINTEIEKISRNAKLSGRKVVRKEDIN